MDHSSLFKYCFQWGPWHAMAELSNSVSNPFLFILHAMTTLNVFSFLLHSFFDKNNKIQSHLDMWDEGQGFTWNWWLIFLCLFILNLGIASLKSISLKCQLNEFSRSLIDGYELPCFEIIYLVSYMALSIYLLTNVPWPGQLSQESCLSLTSIYFWTLTMYLDKLCKYLLNEREVHKTQLLVGFVPGYLTEE